MHSLLFSTLALLSAPPVPVPTIVVPMFHSEIVRDAELIVIGTVTGAASRYEDGRQTIRTYVDLKQLTFAKGGMPSDTLTLRFDGGQVGNDRIEVGSMPRLELGKRYLLYVAGNGRHVSPIVGFNQGVFELAVEQGREVVRDWRGQELIGIHNDRYVFAGKPQPQRAAGPQIASIDQTVVPANPRVAELERAMLEQQKAQRPAPLPELTPVAAQPADPTKVTAPPQARDVGPAREAAPIVVPAEQDRGVRIDVQTLLRTGR